MEKASGMSYSTIKKRLNRISSRLQFVHVEIEPAAEPGERPRVLP